MATADDKFYRARITQRKDFASDLWMIRVQASGEFKFAARPVRHLRSGARSGQAVGAALLHRVFSAMRAKLNFFLSWFPRAN